MVDVRLPTQLVLLIATLACMGDARGQTTSAPAGAATLPATTQAAPRVVDLGEPTRISLEMAGAPPGDLLAAFEKQTKIHFERNHFTRYSLRERRRPVTLSLDNATLFDALRHALPALGMSLDPIYGANPSLTTIIIGAPKFEDFGEHPRLDVGPVTFEVLSVDYVRRSEIGKGQPDGPAKPHRFELFLRVFVEPKVRAALIYPFPEFDAVLDERGRSLVLKKYSVSGIYPVDYDGPLATIFIPLNVARGDGATRLARLAGAVKIRRIVASRRESIDLTTLKEPAEVVAGKTRLIVRPMQPREGGSHVVPVDCASLDKRLGYHHPFMISNIVAGLVEPYDAAGERMPRPVANSARRGALLEAVELRFRGESRVEKYPPPAKLVWDIPSEFEEILVPFEFRDVPITEKLERVGKAD